MAKSVKYTKRRGKNKLFAVCICLLVIATGAYFGMEHLQKQQVLENYNAAVDSILSEDYSDAKTELKDLTDEDTEKVEEASDVDALTEYAAAQLTLTSCAGDPEKFQRNLSDVGDIENEEVNQQYQDALGQTEDAVNIQNKIDDIDFLEVTPDSQDTLTDISEDISGLDDRYETLVDSSKLSDAEEMVSHMQKQDTVGKVMLGICDIGTVKLSSKSAINKIRKAYDGLTKNEQGQILNYKVLTRAETSLSALEKKQKEKEERKKKEAEEKARREAEKAKKEAEKANQSRSMPDSGSDYTVYITNTGNKYHTSGCGYLRSSKISISKSEAVASGYEPCSRCHP